MFTCTVPREIFQNLYFQKYFISAIHQYNLIVNRHGAYFLKTICVSSTCQRGQPFGWTPLGVSVRPTQLSYPPSWALPWTQPPLVTLTHRSCFASPGLASANGGCDYSRQGVITVGGGGNLIRIWRVPMPCWQSVHRLSVSLWTPDSTRAERVHSHSRDRRGGRRTELRAVTCVRPAMTVPSGTESRLSPSRFFLAL